VRIGYVVGGVIGEGVEVRGFTPIAVLSVGNTAIFKEMLTATGRTTISIFVRSVSFAATVAFVFVDGLVTSAYAASQAATADATAAAVPLVWP
jgi:hypothetical protein